MDYHNDVIARLKNLTCKKHIYFFDSCDDAILYILNYMKSVGKTNIFIPDCGGWFSYKKYPKKVGLAIREIRTVDALIDIEDLKSMISKDSFVLINSMGGYFVEEPMKDIDILCKESGCVLINDVSASIGTDNAKYGEFCLGSFGKGKPIGLGEGGFIGSKEMLDIGKSEFASIENMKRLHTAIAGLDTRLASWNAKRQDIIRDLGTRYIILHQESKGINVLTVFHNDVEKENLINYCDKHNLEYVLCPNYIKVNRVALSIEVKRG